jgi:hypothetical protein
MVLPLVLFLLLGLLWAGGVAWRTGDVAVRARHDAWRRKAEAVHGPFDFGGGDGGIVTATVESPVAIAAAVDGPFVPRSTHVDRGGGWNHPAVDMDRTPNWKLQARALRGTAGNVVDEIGVVLSMAAVAPDLVAGAIQAAVAEEVAKAVPGLSSLLSAFKQGSQDLAAEKERIKREEIGRIDGQVAAVQAQLAEERRRLAMLEADIRAAEQQLAGVAADERTKLEDQIRTLRRQADESRVRQQPLTGRLLFFEEQRRITQAQ